MLESIKKADLPFLKGVQKKPDDGEHVWLGQFELFLRLLMSEASPTYGSARTQICASIYSQQISLWSNWITI